MSSSSIDPDVLAFLPVDDDPRPDRRDQAARPIPWFAGHLRVWTAANRTFSELAFSPFQTAAERRISDEGLGLERSTGLTAASSPAKVPSLDDSPMARRYARLGAAAGPLATKAAAAEEFAFWRERGLNGVFFLIGRARNEKSTQVQTEIATILSKIGPIAVLAILQSLRIKPTPGLAYTLLQALGWIPGPAPGFIASRFKPVVEGFLRHPDVDVREAAVGATQLLPAGAATRLLDAALETETDRTVRRAIEEEISDRETE